MTAAEAKIKSLFFYPIKSGGGVKVPRLHFESKGAKFDREWMLVDPSGKFVTQRELPILSKLNVTADDTGLSVGFGQRFIKVPNTDFSNIPANRIIQVKIWKDEVPAKLEPDLISQSICQWLGLDLSALRLVRFLPQANRTNPARFADSRAVLLVNQASLDFLNSKLSIPVPIERFRPNILVEGIRAFEEESWIEIRMGVGTNSVLLRKEKLCTRCVMINIDHKEGQLDKRQSVLKELGRYRQDSKELVFGVLYRVETEGLLEEGDLVSQSFLN